MVKQRLVMGMRVRIACGALVVLQVGGCYAVEPPNLGTLKAVVREYADSGGYLDEVARVARKAQDYLAALPCPQRSSELPRPKQRVGKRRPCAQAVIFDVDETSLSNYAYMREHDFSGSKPVLQEEFCENREPLEAVLNLYRTAQQLGFALFFISGRHECYHEATARNLKRAGYSGWRGLTLRPADWQGSIQEFKAAQRRALVAQGYEIVASIGDQYSDLLGGNAGAEFKLPNPFYVSS